MSAPFSLHSTAWECSALSHCGEFRETPQVAPGFVPLRRGKPQLKERDFQSLNWDKSEAEADFAVAKAGAVAAPARRTAAPRVVVPTAATVHAGRAG